MSAMVPTGRDTPFLGALPLSPCLVTCSLHAPVHRARDDLCAPRVSLCCTLPLQAGGPLELSISVVAVHSCSLSARPPPGPEPGGPAAPSEASTITTPAPRNVGYTTGGAPPHCGPRSRHCRWAPAHCRSIVWSLSTPRCPLILCREADVRRLPPACPASILPSLCPSPRHIVGPPSLVARHYCPRAAAPVLTHSSPSLLAAPRRASPLNLSPPSCAREHPRTGPSYYHDPANIPRLSLILCVTDHHVSLLVHSPGPPLGPRYRVPQAPADRC